MPSERSENSDSWGIGSLDLHLWNEGTHQRAHEMLGAHVGTWGGVFGTRFVVWAPNARSVTVPGDWNSWQARARPGARGSLAHDAPIAIYEAHLGSWQRGPSGETLSYRELAPRIARHVRMLGFTHVELTPVMEHPFGGSWGYQVTGYFALAFMYASPGKKLLFMGTELAGWDEWDEARSLPLAQLEHAPASKLLADLNALYQSQPALYQRDTEEGGLSWIHAGDAEPSVIVIERRGYEGTEPVIVALSFTPVPRHGYRVPLHGSASGRYRELLNTDAEVYGGSGVGNLGAVFSQPDPPGDSCSLSLTLPPLSAVFLSRGA